MAPLTTFTGTARFDFASAEYAALFERSGATAFQHPIWLGAFYRQLATGKHVEPLVVVGRSGCNGELVAVLPLVRRRVDGRTLVEFAFEGVTDYACPVLDETVGRGFCSDSMLELRAAIGPHDALRIGPVRQQDLPLWSPLLRVDPEVLSYSAHAVCLEEPFTAWRTGQLGRERRSQLDRKARAMRRQGTLRLDIAMGGEIDAALARLREFRRGRFEDDPTQTPSGFDFYHEVATRGARCDFARTYVLSCGESPVAVCFGLVDGDTFRYLLLGCDYGRFGKQSPGMLAFDRVMEHWLACGGTRFDFTIGDELYKSAFFGCAALPMYSFEGEYDAQGSSRPSRPTGGACR